MCQTRLKLSSNVNEYKPLEGGSDESGSDNEFIADDGEVGRCRLTL